MHLTKWKIKKDFYFFNVIFFALNTPPMESAVDEVRSCRCTVGSGQDGGGGVMEGERKWQMNDVMYRQNTRRPQSWLDRFLKTEKFKRLESEPTTTSRERPTGAERLLPARLNARQETNVQMICSDHRNKGVQTRVQCSLDKFTSRARIESEERRGLSRPRSVERGTETLNVFRSWDTAIACI